MRIQDRTTLGPTATPAGRAGETQKAGQETTGQTPLTSSADGDRVELSSALGRLSQAISSYASQRAERIQALAGEYQAGRFRPNALATSRALVAEALAAHG